MQCVDDMVEMMNMTFLMITVTIPLFDCAQKELRKYINAGFDSKVRSRYSFLWQTCRQGVNIEYNYGDYQRYWQIFNKGRD